MNTVLMCSLPTSQEAIAMMDAFKAAGIPPEHLSLIATKDPGDLPPFSDRVHSLASPILIDSLMSGALGAGLGILVSVLSRLLPSLEPYKNWDPLSIIEATTAAGVLLGGLLSLLFRLSGDTGQPPAGSSHPEGYLVTLRPADDQETAIAHDVVIASGHSDVVQSTEPGHA